MPRRSNIPNLVRDIRESLSMTQQQLADRLRLSRRTIQQVELGKQAPSPEFVDALRDLSGIVIPINSNGEYQLDSAISEKTFATITSPDDVREAEEEDRVRLQDIVTASTEIIRIIGLASIKKGCLVLFLRSLERFFSNHIKREKIKSHMHLVLKEWYREIEGQACDFSADLAEHSPFVAGALLNTDYEYLKKNYLVQLEHLLLKTLNRHDLDQHTKQAFETSLRECRKVQNLK